MPADPTPATYLCTSDYASYVTAYGKEKADSMKAIYQGCSQLKSFQNASPNYGLVWSGSAKFGAIAGFGIFGIMYLFTIFSIIADIFKRQKEYEEMVSKDKDTLTGLGIDVLSLDKELNERLNAKNVDENADDQLMGEAAKLQKGEY